MPKVKNKGSNVLTLARTEEFMSVTSAGQGIGSWAPGGVSGSPINPANPILFPWMSGLATLYEYYVFKSFRVNYFPQVGTGDNGNGRVCIAVDYDDHDVPFSTIPEAMNNKDSVSTVPWNRMQFVATPKNLHLRKTYKIGVADTLDADEELHNVGRLQILWDSTATSTLGYCTVSYVVDLISPQFHIPGTLLNRGSLGPTETPKIDTTTAGNIGGGAMLLEGSVPMKCGYTPTGGDGFYGDTPLLFPDHDSFLAYQGASAYGLSDFTFLGGATNISRPKLAEHNPAICWDSETYFQTDGGESRRFLTWNKTGGLSTSPVSFNTMKGVQMGVCFNKTGYYFCELKFGVLTNGNEPNLKYDSSDRTGNRYELEVGFTSTDNKTNVYSKSTAGAEPIFRGAIQLLSSTGLVNHQVATAAGDLFKIVYKELPWASHAAAATFVCSVGVFVRVVSKSVTNPTLAFRIKALGDAFTVTSNLILAYSAYNTGMDVSDSGSTGSDSRIKPSLIVTQVPQDALDII
jgi:hypothetical protein